MLVCPERIQAVLATSATQWQNNLAGFDRVLDLLAEPVELGDRPGALAVRPGAVAGRITLEGVGFTYPGTTRAVLRARWRRSSSRRRFPPLHS